MTVNDLLAGNLQGSLGMLKMHVADFSDADLLARPVPGANHANWQLGHLITSENQMMSACGATMPPLPAGFADRYTKETAKLDTPSTFAPKSVLLEQLEKTRAATIAFAQSLPPEKLAAPSPVMPEFFPNIAALLAMSSSHDSMHMGQIQVLRRKLGKPLLF